MQKTMMQGVLALSLLFPLIAQAQQTKPDLLPRDLEIELALSGLPSHLRPEATVYALERGGYVKAQQGTNGFSCLVRRVGVVPAMFHRSFIVLCYDAEGSRTILTSDLDQARLFEQGKRHDEVAAIIKERWASGTYPSPGPGISYMLSPIMHVVPLGGQPTGYIPHIMFYGPNKTNADVGAGTPLNPMGYVPFMPEPGHPYSMIVVPTGEKERAAIIAQEKALIARMEPYVKRSSGSP